MRVLGTFALLLLVGGGLAEASDDVRLAHAAMNGDGRAVRALIQQKVDVNTPGADGTPALHWLVRADDLEAVALVIRGGANIGAENRYGIAPPARARCTPLWAAVEVRNLDFDTRAAAAFLTGAHPEEGIEARVGVSLDQVVAGRIGQDTPLPSLELTIEEAVLSCEAGFSCAYRNTIAWKSPTAPLPMENNPQVVFEKLFGDGSTDAQRRARRRQSRSHLDSVMGQVATLQKDLPAGDRSRLDEYLDNVREIERRIQRAEQQRLTELVVPDAPVGVPDSFDEHAKLMIDLQVLAFQADITRVTTLMFARELSNRTFPESGVRDPFHNLSHHSNNRANMDRFAIVNQYHVALFAHVLDKLKAVADGDGTLLDHSMLLYGSALSDGNEHNHDPLPVLLAGGASGQLQGDVHLEAAPHTTMSNLLLAMLDKLGIDMDNFGDSTGKLDI